MSVIPAPARDADDVKAELMRMPAVVAVQGAAATTDAVDARLEQFDEILLVTVAIAGAMALLVAFNATAINAPLLTLRRLRRTDVAAALRIVE